MGPWSPERPHEENGLVHRSAIAEPIEAEWVRGGGPCIVLGGHRWSGHTARTFERPRNNRPLVGEMKSQCWCGGRCIHDRLSSQGGRLEWGCPLGDPKRDRGRCTGDPEPSSRSPLCPARSLFLLSPATFSGRRSLAWHLGG